MAICLNFNRREAGKYNVVLIVEGKEFFVLRQHLGVYSPVLHTLLMRDGDDIDVNEEIVLNDVDSDAFQVFLELINGKNSLSDDTVEDVLEMSTQWNARIVIRACERFLENCGLSNEEKFFLADKYSILGLKIQLLAEVHTKGHLEQLLPDVVNGFSQETLQLIFNKARELLRAAPNPPAPRVAPPAGPPVLQALEEQLQVLLQNQEEIREMLRRQDAAVRGVLEVFQGAGPVVADQEVEPAAENLEDQEMEPTAPDFPNQEMELAEPNVPNQEVEPDAQNFPIQEVEPAAPDLANQEAPPAAAEEIIYADVPVLEPFDLNAAVTAYEILWVNQANELLANINHQTRNASAILPGAARRERDRAARFVQELVQRGEWVRGMLLDLQRQPARVRASRVDTVRRRMFHGIQAAVEDQLGRVNRDQVDQHIAELDLRQEWIEATLGDWIQGPAGREQPGPIPVRMYARRPAAPPGIEEDLRRRMEEACGELEEMGEVPLEDNPPGARQAELDHADPAMHLIVLRRLWLTDIIHDFVRQLYHLGRFDPDDVLENLVAKVAGYPQQRRQEIMRERELAVRRLEALRREMRTMDRVLQEAAAPPGRRRRVYSEEFIECVQRYRQSYDGLVERCVEEIAAVDRRLQELQ